MEFIDFRSRFLCQDFFALAVKPEVSVKGGGNINRDGGMEGGEVRDRHDHDDRCVDCGAIDSKHDHVAGNPCERGPVPLRVRDAPYP